MTDAADDVDPSVGVDALLAEDRAKIEPRPRPAELAALVARGALVVDIRPEYVRRDEGELPGAVVIERNVLEWRLDPAGPHRIAEAGDPEREIILVCNEGYASSLAAATLRRLGLGRATDLDGGYRAWKDLDRPACDHRMWGIHPGSRAQNGP